MVALSAGCEYMGDTHGSGVVCSGDYVLEMSGVRVEWVRGLGLCFTNPIGKGGVGHVSLFGLWW